jgi:hypothetical protein
MPEDALFLLIIGLGAGVLSGMFGIGGGVIIVPSLIVFLGFSTIEAISTSLAALLLPVGILAVVAYYRADLLDLRSALLVAIGLITTTWLGTQIALSLPATTLKQIYGVFLLYVSWRFIEPRKLYYRWLARRRAENDEDLVSSGIAQGELPAEEKKVAWYWVLMVGLVAGVASGLFGIGGGAVIVPTLVVLLGYEQKRAVGTSLGALLLPVGLPGVLSYQDAGVLDVAQAAPIAVGLMLGAVVGAQITLQLPSTTVKRLYGVFLFLVGLNFIFSA